MRRRALSCRAAAATERALSVPSLIRFLVILGALAGIAYAAMFAIVVTVQPQPREMTQIVPPARLNR